MKMLFLAKTSVFIMTGLIVAGLALVLFKITDNLQKDKPQNTQSTPLLTQQEKITHMSACASFVCLLAETATGQARPVDCESEQWPFTPSSASEKEIKKADINEKFIHFWHNESVYGDLLG